MQILPRTGPPGVVLALLLASGGGCAHGPGQGPAANRTVSQINVVPDFLAAWDSVRTAPRAEQLDRSRQALLASHPELFGPEVFGPAPALDRDLERLLVEMPRLEPKLEALSERMPGDVERSARSFLDQFPELDWAGPVALSLSFSHFEAVWRTVSGRRTLVLGLDAFAYYRGPYAPVEPVVHHALASALLPPWKGPGPVPVWWALWEEGFPLAAVRTLDPGVTDAELRLPDEGRDPAYLAALARRVRGALDSTRESDRRAVTSVAGIAPAGAGRWLALRAAQQIVAGRTLHDAARLGGPPLRAAVDSALATLERPGS
ncbi:MAG TPA: hypothetical protein VLT82_20450 [Myxococcaceae bacterium]|nr:hypothetical protein [Myxococcaceae bacterium]